MATIDEALVVLNQILEAMATRPDCGDWGEPVDYSLLVRQDQPGGAGQFKIEDLPVAANRYIARIAGDIQVRTFAEVASDIGVGTEDTPTLTGVNLGTGELTCGSINRAAGTLTLEINGTPQVSITSTTVTYAGDVVITGTTTFSSNIIIPDAGWVGSVTTNQSIQIEADGDIVIPNMLAVTGDIQVTGNILLMTNNGGVGYSDNSPMLVFNNTDDQVELTGGGGLTFASSPGVITQNTADGSDNAYTQICGGGVVSNTRGAYCNIFGNEHISAPGVFEILAGNVTGGVIRFITGNSATRMVIDKDGLTTIYGNLVIPDAGYIGSASDTDAFQIEADGDIVMSQDLAVSGTLNVTGALTASNYTAANLLTACATNAGALDFSAASKTLTVADNVTVGAVIDDLNNLGAPASDGQFIVATGAGAFAYESGATARASLGLTIGTNVQAYGAVLDNLNTLGEPASDGQFLVATGQGVFDYESTTTARTSLGIGEGDTPTLASLVLGADPSIISSAHEIQIKPSGDNDDYLEFRTSGGVPFIKIMSGRAIVFEADSSEHIALELSAQNGVLYGGIVYAKPTATIFPAAETTVYSTGPINLMASFDLSDYLQISCPANVPTIGTVGDCHLKLSASSGEILLDDNTTISGTLDITGITTAASLILTADPSVISSVDAIVLYSSGDSDDYFSFTTVVGVPTITTVGDCDLKLVASSGEIQLDDNTTINGTLDAGATTLTGALDIGANNLTCTGTGHDGFSDFVANEHIDWTGALEGLATMGGIDVGGNITSAGTIKSTSSWGIFLDASASGAKAVFRVTGGAAKSAEFLFYANAGATNADKMRITANADGTFDISGKGSGNWVQGLVMDSTTATFIALPTYSKDVGATTRDLIIDDVGRIGYQASGKKYKKDIQDLTNSELIYQLRPVKFKWKKNDNKGVGLIAEEVSILNANDVIPNLVSYKPLYKETRVYEGDDPSGEPQYRIKKEVIGEDLNVPETINYRNLIVPMLAEIQKLKTRVEVLEKK